MDAIAMRATVSALRDVEFDIIRAEEAVKLRGAWTSDDGERVHLEAAARNLDLAQRAINRAIKRVESPPKAAS